MSEQTKAFTCVNCPLGCPLVVTLDAQGAVASVAGNTCARGEAYAREEAVRPMRTITATVCAEGCLEPLSVKTAAPVPQELYRAVLDAIAEIKVALPVRIGDVVCENICDTGVPVVATKSLP